jgi:hypothetical protein
MLVLKLKLTIISCLIGIGAAMASSYTMRIDEIQDFYIDDLGNRFDIVYPNAGTCTVSLVHFCHARFSRAGINAPWILYGPIVKGNRPF